MTRDFYINSVRKVTQNIKRFGMEDVLKQQTLAEHGYHTLNLFLIACNFLDYDPTPREMDKVLNHDVLECLTGDLNKMVKEHNEATKEAWGIIENELYKDDPKLFMYSDLNRGYRTKFNNIWKFCDAMEAYLYCCEERKRGNTNVRRAEDYYYDKLVKMNEKLFRHITGSDQ